MKEKEDTESERNKKRSKHKQKKLLKDSREVSLPKKTKALRILVYHHELKP